MLLALRKNKPWTRDNLIKLILSKLGTRAKRDSRGTGAPLKAFSM